MGPVGAEFPLNWYPSLQFQPFEIESAVRAKIVDSASKFELPVCPITRKPIKNVELLDESSCLDVPSYELELLGEGGAGWKDEVNMTEGNRPYLFPTNFLLLVGMSVSTGMEKRERSDLVLS